MQALVAVKPVLNPSAPLRFASDESGIDLRGVRTVLNPVDEVAVEEAVRLRDGGAVAAVIAVSVGSAGCEIALRAALAIGTDRALLVQSPAALEPLAVAKLLAAVSRAESIGLALLGRRSADDGSGQVGPMLAALLDWPQAIASVMLTIHGITATAVRHYDGGQESVEVSLPGVVTVELRLNAPRVPSLVRVLRARAHPLERVAGDPIPPAQHQLIRVTPAIRRRTGTKVPDATALIARLHAAGIV